MNRKLYLLKLLFLQTKPHIRFYIYVLYKSRKKSSLIKMNHPIIPFSLNGSNNRQQKIKIENRYYLDFIDQSIGLIEREEKEDSVEEEIMDFLNMPGWSLIPWKNL